MNEQTSKTRKAKMFGVYVISESGVRTKLANVEHYSKPQAKNRALEGKIEVEELAYDDLMRIGADGEGVLRLDENEDDGQADAFGRNFGGTD